MSHTPALYSTAEPRFYGAVRHTGGDESAQRIAEWLNTSAADDGITNDPAFIRTARSVRYQGGFMLISDEVSTVVHMGWWVVRSGTLRVFALPDVEFRELFTYECTWAETEQ